jgi:hypothetical protein
MLSAANMFPELNIHLRASDRVTEPGPPKPLKFCGSSKTRQYLSSVVGMEPSSSRTNAPLFTMGAMWFTFRL